MSLADRPMDGGVRTAAAVPPRTLTQTIQGLLDAVRSVPGFVSAAVARRDGLVVSHTFASGREAASLCAMGAAVIGASERAATELDQGGVLRCLVDCERGTLVITEAGPEALVVALTTSGTNLGLVIMELRKVAAEVQRALEAL